MDDIRVVRYNEPGVVVLGVETLTVEELKRRAGMETLRDVQRIEFFLLLLFIEGVGQHMVDFVTYPTVPQTLMLVMPGQVQQFHLHPGLAGQLIVIDPAFLLPDRTAPEAPGQPLWWPACTHLPDGLSGEFLSVAAAIRADSARYDGHPLRRSLLQHRLYTLLLQLRLFHDGAPVPVASGRAYALLDRFKHLLEQEFATHHSIPFYAGRLGCAEKTLTRACLLAEGCTAKAILDRRVLLEAKRLLAHSRDGVADVSQRLGFSETTNFVRFFRRHEGVTPARFRDRHARPQ